MKALLIALFLTLSVMALSATSVEAAQRVNGYYRSNGTYVQPYYRSNSNSTKYDNYSTRGNYNPFTGKYGTRNPW